MLQISKYNLHSLEWEMGLFSTLVIYSRTFGAWMAVAVITWNLEPTSMYWLTSHQLKGKSNFGGDSKELVVSLGVYTRSGLQN